MLITAKRCMCRVNGRRMYFKGSLLPCFFPSPSLSVFPRRWNGFEMVQVYLKMERDVAQGSLGDRIRG